jgi:hypothetical protein
VASTANPRLSSCRRVPFALVQPRSHLVNSAACTPEKIRELRSWAGKVLDAVAVHSGPGVDGTVRSRAQLGSCGRHVSFKARVISLRRPTVSRKGSSATRTGERARMRHCVVA